jgi:hypothetical protein
MIVPRSCGSRQEGARNRVWAAIPPDKAARDARILIM